MEIQFVIVRSENREYLCYKAEDVYVDVSNPMMTFTDGEDVFETVEPDCSLMRKEYGVKGERFYLVPCFYGNGWLALTLASVEDEQEYIVLSVNLEEMDALGLPDRTFIDVNHYPEAMEFLIANELATDSGYRRRSGFVWPRSIYRFFTDITPRCSKKPISSSLNMNLKGIIQTDRGRIRTPSV